MEQNQPKLVDRVFAKCQAMGRAKNTATAYWNLTAV